MLQGNKITMSYKEMKNYRTHNLHLSEISQNLTISVNLTTGNLMQQFALQLTNLKRDRNSNYQRVYL